MGRKGFVMAAKRKTKRKRSASGSKTDERDTGAFAEVWRVVRRIPRGRVATYGRISQLIAKRLTPVGVGWALGAAPKNVPWQRVVNGKGGISTDRQHAGLQRAMLEAEGVRFDAQGRIDLERYQW